MLQTRFWHFRTETKVISRERVQWLQFFVQSSALNMHLMFLPLFVASPVEQNIWGDTVALCSSHTLLLFKSQKRIHVHTFSSLNSVASTTFLLAAVWLFSWLGTFRAPIWTVSWHQREVHGLKPAANDSTFNFHSYKKTWMHNNWKFEWSFPSFRLRRAKGPVASCHSKGNISRVQVVGTADPRHFFSCFQASIIWSNVEILNYIVL